MWWLKIVWSLLKFVNEMLKVVGFAEELDWVAEFGGAKAVVEMGKAEIQR
ncbi:hypothetical protein [Salinibacillus xinjiangensis]|uniref:Uncharacterized protein n=1 Tax=Salinibacillus xinjiangensis TaxID=1229268 RepID=A0A6G1XAB8_9BACI|nr:hypothetical protein [Salinibacillus xinjiangensis]MRG87846.1 hypothetical protein [Salinibacillus xinjiangensis]